MRLLEHFMPWYAAEKQAARAAHTDEVAAKVQESLQRVITARDRADVMVRSYERAQEQLCRH
jgi:hypothetical protein